MNGLYNLFLNLPERKIRKKERKKYAFINVYRQFAPNAMKRLPNEKELTKQIIDLLKAKGHLVFRTHRPGQYATERGVPDLCGCLAHNGQCFFVEVKGPRSQIRPEQLAWIQYAQSRNAIAFVADSLETVIQKLNLEVLL